MKPLTYICSPYSDPDPHVRWLRYEAACRVTAKLISEGRLVFSPIAHSHPVAIAGGMGKGFDVWREWCLEMLHRCDDVLVLKLDGWLQSIGVNHEIAVAQAAGLVVRYREVDGEMTQEGQR